MKYDALIFDIDGTLWSAASTSAKAWNAGLASLGIERTITAQDVANVSGLPVAQCIEHLFPGLSADYPTLHETLNRYEIDYFNKEGGEFFDGVLDGINRLSKNFPIFLVSNCQEWYLKFFLKFSQLESILSGMDCHGLSQATKDVMFARLQRDHGFKTPVYIGDTQLDLDSSRKAGIDFILMNYGFGDVHGAEREFESFDELVVFLMDER